MALIEGSPVKIHQEYVKFRRGVSERLGWLLGAAINYLMEHVGQVGDVVLSALDEDNFQALRSAKWVLIDGRNIVGSKLSQLTGWANLPNSAGTYFRMMNLSSGRIPEGNVVVGSYLGDMFKLHKHDGSNTCGSNGTHDVDGGDQHYNSDPNIGGIVAEGGAETRPKSTVWYAYIRIN